jgi:hypothetical protein
MLARDIRLLRVVEARGKAEGADHERSSEPARNGVEWCHGAELNHRHKDFQSSALPLSYRGKWIINPKLALPSVAPIKTTLPIH